MCKSRKAICRSATRLTQRWWTRTCGAEPPFGATLGSAAFSTRFKITAASLNRARPRSRWFLSSFFPRKKKKTSVGKGTFKLNCIAKVRALSIHSLMDGKNSLVTSFDIRRHEHSWLFSVPIRCMPTNRPERSYQTGQVLRYMLAPSSKKGIHIISGLSLCFYSVCESIHV